MNDNNLKWRSVLVVAFAGLALACGGPESSATQTSPTATSSQPADPNLAAAAETPQSPEDKMPRVSVQEAIQQQKDGSALIIDVRGTEAFTISHIKGALDINLSRLEAGDFQGLPSAKRIIAYCT